MKDNNEKKPQIIAFSKEDVKTMSHLYADIKGKGIDNLKERLETTASNDVVTLKLKK